MVLQLRPKNATAASGVIPSTLVAWCFNFDLNVVKRPKLKHHATKVGGIFYVHQGTRIRRKLKYHAAKSRWYPSFETLSCGSPLLTNISVRLCLTDGEAKPRAQCIKYHAGKPQAFRTEGG